MTSLPIDDNEEEGFFPPQPWLAVAIVCIWVAIITAVGGNILILLSYWRDPLLRDVHNLYLMHLAVSDCLIGAISMPLYLIYSVMNKNWYLGKVVCKAFLMADFTFTGNSAIIVSLVAYDRLALVTLGANYKATETRCRAYFRLAVCWFFSFALFSPAILLWETISGRSVVPSNECDTEYNQHFAFVLASEGIAFVVPSFSLTVLIVLLFLALRKRRNKVGIRRKCSVQVRKSSGQLRQSPERVKQMQLRHSPEQVLKSPNQLQQRPMQTDVENSPDPTPQIAETVRLNAQRLINSDPVTNTSIPQSKTEAQVGPSSEPTRHVEPLTNGHYKQNGATTKAGVHWCTTTYKEGLSPQVESIDPLENGYNQGNGPATKTRLSQLDDKERKDVGTHPGQNKSLGNGNDKNKEAARRSNLSLPYPTVRSSSSQHVSRRLLAGHRERRVALILAGLVLALVVCWLPYTISTIVLAACKNCVNKALYEFFIWLVWLKSSFNPFLYAYMSPRFRKNFQKLLGPLCPQACRIRRKQTNGSVNTISGMSGL